MVRLQWVVVLVLIDHYFIPDRKQVGGRWRECSLGGMVQDRLKLICKIISFI